MSMGSGLVRVSSFLVVLYAAFSWMSSPARRAPPLENLGDPTRPHENSPPSLHPDVCVLFSFS